MNITFLIVIVSSQTKALSHNEGDCAWRQELYAAICFQFQVKVAEFLELESKFWVKVPSKS